MPNPTSSDRHVDSLAADVSIGFMQEEGDALFGQIAPVQRVKKLSDKYAIFPSGTWNKLQMLQRAPGDAAVEGQFTISNDNYSIDIFSVTHKDPREEVDTADEVFEPSVEAEQWGAGQMLMKGDALVAAAMMAPAVWDTDVDGTTGTPSVGTSVLQWTEPGSDPITDMVTLNGLVKKKSTKWANVGCIGFDVWTALINHAAIIDRTKHVSKDSITPEILAALFKLEKLIVPGLTQNTAELGQTASMNFIVGAKDVGLFYVPKTPGKRTLSAAYIYALDAGDYKEGVRVTKWYDEKKNSDMSQFDFAVDVKITATSAGAFIDDAVA